MRKNKNILNLFKMAGGKRKTASSKQKSGEKSSEPPGKPLKLIKKEIRKQCRTTLCNFY